MRHPASAMAAVTGRSAGGDPAVLEPRAQGGRRRSRSVGQAGEQAVDRVHGELVLDQLHEVGEGGAGGAGVAVGGLPLRLVGERGLVAVVAVGDDHGLLGHRRGDRGDSRRVVDPPHGVAHAVLVDDVGQRRVVHRAGGR